MAIARRVVMPELSALPSAIPPSHERIFRTSAVSQQRSRGAPRQEVSIGVDAPLFERDAAEIRVVLMGRNAGDRTSALPRSFTEPLAVLLKLPTEVDLSGNLLTARPDGRHVLDERRERRAQFTILLPI